MRRRRILAACGCLLTGPGCLSLGRSSPRETVTPVPRASIDAAERSTPDGRGQIDVLEAAVQPGVVGPTSPFSVGVFDDAGQYLVVAVDGSDSRPASEAFELTFDGSTVAPTEYVNGLFRDARWGVSYSRGTGPLVFALPETGDASETRLTWPGGEWVPPTDVREQLAAPLPPFTATLDGPARVDADVRPRVTVTVRNEGERVGRYLYAFTRIEAGGTAEPVSRLTGALWPGATIGYRFEAANPAEESFPRESIYRLDGPGQHQDAVLRITPTDSGGPTESGGE